jgi:hypothetical protein
MAFHLAAVSQLEHAAAQPMLALLLGAVSLLDATVGQAGGTAFLAMMAFASFPSNEMRPKALLLNIVAATYSTWPFNRGNLVDWTKLRPCCLHRCRLRSWVDSLCSMSASITPIRGLLPHLP